MDKTPISRLQEICAHNGLTAEYQLLSVEGVVHAPTFIYRVQVGEYYASASGQSKKKAKHAVAKAVIEVLIKESDLQIENAEIILEMLSQQETSETIETENNEEKCDEEEDEDSNPVGKLQEICMKRHWRPPHYETISEDGLPHERIFKMKCIVENMDFHEIGIGKSKRLAKRKAAHLMIKRLKDENLADSDELTDKFHDKKFKNADTPFIEDWIESKASGKVIPAKQKIDNFYRSINEQKSKQIEKLLNDCLKPNVEYEMGLYYEKDYLKLLGELTQIIDCSFKVLTVPQLSYSGNYQCLVHIIPNEISYSDLPVLTSWGTSEQLDDAKQTAAGSALKLFSFLKMASEISFNDVNEP